MLCASVCCCGVASWAVSGESKESQKKKKKSWHESSKIITDSGLPPRRRKPNYWGGILLYRFPPICNLTKSQVKI